MRRGLGLGVVLAWVGLAFAAKAQDAPSRGLAVTLHGRSTTASARAEQAAWLSVTVPLDRAAAPRPVARAPEPEPEAPPAEASAAAPPEAAFDYRALEVLSEFSRRAVKVALAVAGAARERRRIDGLASRSRWSAILPELRLRAQRSTDQALRWAPTNDDPYRVTQADGAGTTLEASASFHLDRLVFSRDELTAERLRQDAGRERLKLEQRVLVAVLGLFRARQRSCAPGAEEGARLEQQLRVIELAVELDALTAGWFSERAPDLSRSLWGFPEAALGACQAPEPAPAPEPTKAVASLDDSE